MNTELPDCTKCQKPKSMQKAKGKQRNTRNKEQPIDLDPAKAWIKNLGAGTTKEMPKLKTKRDKTLMMVTTFPTTHTPSTPVSTSTAKNKSVTVSKTNGMQLALSSDVEKCNSVGKIMDSTMVSIQQINDAEVDEPAKSSEQAIGNVTSDDDSMNYQTCIELDTTLINVNETKTETIDTEPISSTAPAQSKTNPILTKSKMMDFKTNQSFKHFPLELNTILENETSLYEPMGTIEWMNARMKDPEKLSQELELVKREWNEHLDDTIINETLPHELDISIKPSTAHELSIPLASFDWIPFPASFALSPTVLHDTKLTDTLSSLPLNSTTLPTDTFAELDKAKQNLREMDSFKPELEPICNANNNILDAHTPFKIPSYAQFKSEKKSHKKSKPSDMSQSLWDQASNQVPKTPSLSNDAFIHPVYMREEDVNRLIQSGHIFLTEGRLHYQHKKTAQKKIF